MDYFHSYSLAPDAGVVAAWDSQVAAADQVPSLRELLSQRGAEIFPEFAQRYGEIRALPRSARRALQRRLAASREYVGVSPEWRRKLAHSIAGAALLLALGGPAHAIDIFVTTKVADFVDGDGQCSLIEAIANANSDLLVSGDCPAGSGADVIHLPKGAQKLTYAYTNFYGYTGLPRITSDITIQGNRTKISRGSKTFFRHFAVDNGGTLTLAGVALSGGNASSDRTTSGDAHGGAIYVHLGGSLTVQNSTISGNVGSRGGAIYAADDILITDASVLSKNTASAGGAVFNRSGTATISNSSIITGNKASDGGGIYNHFAETVIDGSTVSKNSAGDGGGILNALGNLQIVNNSIVTGNKATGDGGGVNSHAYTVIHASTLSKNSAGDRGGGAFSNSNTFVLTNSAVLSNKAGTSGGGVYRTGTVFVNTNNNFDKNKAPSFPYVGP